MHEEITDTLNKPRQNENKHVAESTESFRASAHKIIGIRHGKETEGI